MDGHGRARGCRVPTDSPDLRAGSVLLIILGGSVIALNAVSSATIEILGIGTLGAAVGASILIGVRAYRPDYARAWTLLCCCAISLLGAWGLTALPDLRHHFDLYLVPAALIVIGSASLAAAVVTFARRQRREWDKGSLVEMVMVAASAAAPTIALLVLPDIGVHDLPVYMNAATDLLPLGMIWSAVVLLRVTIWSGRWSAASSLLFASLLMMTVASVGLALAAPPTFLLSTSALIAGVVLIGLAALQPSMTTLTLSVQSEREVDGTAFAVVALAVPILTLAASWVLADRIQLPTYLSIQIVITGLVVWRVRSLFKLMRRARTVAEASEDYYRTVLDNVADLIVALDADGMATYVSPSSWEILGRTPEELAGGRALDIVHSEDQEMAGALLDLALNAPGQRVSGELRAIAADSTIRILSGSATCLDGDHEGAKVVIGLHDVTAQKRMEEELAHRAMHDEMTGLPNRALVRDRCGQMLARSERSGNMMAALFVDLDGFKSVNDTFGHAAGDALLVAVSARMSAAIRASDTVGRIGGDEFVILTEGDATGPGPEPVAERILDLMREPFHLEGIVDAPLFITASIGIAEAPRASADELLRDADVALYRAKALGKARFVSFEPEMFSEMRKHTELEMDLRDALESKQFFLVYQPNVDLESLRVKGVEALIRWRHPVRGVVSPAEFIPVLEENGSIIEIGRWVLLEACMQAMAWHRKGLGLSMSVNVSARQLESDDLIDNVKGALETSHLNPDLLTLEVTETTLMRDAERTAIRLEQLRGLGVHIAIDDFGTGYCSLGYLQRFPIDILKIDQSFVAGLGYSEDARTLVRTLIRLGTELGLVTLAEGIEDNDQLDELRRQHCEVGQGYLFARPLEPRALEDFLSSGEIGSELVAAESTSSAERSV
jgi:diguanylate cyclase (GGDEF)-like protein/PAS domain S-box-containing protein